MIDKRVQDWCAGAQAMTVQECKARGAAEDPATQHHHQQQAGCCRQASAADMLTVPENLECSEKEQPQQQGQQQQNGLCRSQDSENLLGRVLAGESFLLVLMCAVFGYVVGVSKGVNRELLRERRSDSAWSQCILVS